MGVSLSEDELRRVNDRRRKAEWKEYLSRESALEVYGSVTKKLLTSRHTLIQYFDLGLQNDGYWGFHHIALQSEDIFDVLRVKYPECDFTMMMDSSAGRTRKEEMD